REEQAAGSALDAAPPSGGRGVQTANERPLDRGSVVRLRLRASRLGPPCGPPASSASVSQCLRGLSKSIRRLLSRRPAQAAAADEVQVDMEDGLAGVAVRVEHGPETAGGNPAVLRDGGGPPDDFTDDLIIVRRQFV